jgi:hypothetical protein
MVNKIGKNSGLGFDPKSRALPAELNLDIIHFLACAPCLSRDYACIQRPCPF